MKTLPVYSSLLALALLSACGVPRAALDQARIAASDTAIPADNAQLRSALLAQASQWQNFSDTLSRRELGGLWGVDTSYIESVQHIAAIAQRQAALIQQNADDPALNRALLQEFHNRWQQMQTYLER